MNNFKEIFGARFILLTLAVVGLVLTFLAALFLQLSSSITALPFLIFGGLTILGVRDLTQTRHALLRNYPIAGHIRFLLEKIRPEIRQYFLESDMDGMPFPRDKRAIVYQRAKRALDKRPFGTQFDVYENRFEWLHHSIAPKPPSKEAFRTTVGGPDCTKPYSASVFNISAMSYGSLSANAIRSLNRGAKIGGFAHDTGEGGVSPYHREFGGDIIWEIGSGYFGCRNSEGTFSDERFAKTAKLDQVRMIEIKLSQGAKPGHGGVLPAVKVTPEIAFIADRCPTGVATQDPARQRAIVVPDKAERVASFHRETVKALTELISAAGLSHPHDLRPTHFMQRAAPDRSISFEELYHCMKPGELLNGKAPPNMLHAWKMATPKSFAAQLQ
jgi:glutamate synthase domain-containing protein 2